MNRLDDAIQIDLIINNFSTTRSNVEGEKMRESEREDFRYGQSILIY